ncbi:MAG TPA: hypothetical protein VK477_13380 [Acidobacteriota bacterium]|nr:hypothetical protein [Acidobacteriota bacterium]
MFAVKLILTLALAWSVVGTIVLLFLPPALKVGKDRTALLIGGPFYWALELRGWLLARAPLTAERWIDLAYALFAGACLGVLLLG